MRKEFGRGRSTLTLALICLLLPALALPATASEGDDLEERVAELEKQAADQWKFHWGNGFKLDSPDGKFKLKFGGRIQADFQFIASQDPIIEREFQFEDGSEFRRARLFFEGTLYGNIIFKAQYDFAGGDTDFKDVWLGFKGKGYQVRLGHFKEPFSLGELTSSKYLAFNERALVNVFSPGRNFGVGVEGSQDRYTWGFGVFREANDFGISVGDDARNITGRFVYRPIYEDGGKKMLHVGVSATDKDTFGLSDDFRIRTRAEFHFGSNRPIDTGRFATDGQQSYDFELAFVNGPFWFEGEYMRSRVDKIDEITTPTEPPPPPTITELDFDGYYVQAGYYLTGEQRRYKTKYGAWDRQKPKSNFGTGGKGAWEIAARWSELDLSDEDINGGLLESFTVAVYWYLNPATVFKLNYISADRSEGISLVDPSQAIGGKVDVVTFRAQIDF